MRKHLRVVESLHPVFQSYLKTHLSQIRQTLHMSTGNYEATLQEIMQNDPKGRSIINNALESMATGFQELGFGALPKDFLKPE